jgi:ABC-type multidrug transport system fused ATPase/permease subunit
MKKLLNLFFVLLLLSSFVSAQFGDLENNLEDVENNLEEIEDFIDDPGEESKAYLQKEWRKILEKDSVGRGILLVSDFFKNFNPLFKIILGVEYSLSWIFVYAIIIWLTLFFSLSKSLEGVFENSLFSLGISFVAVSLIGVSGAIKQGVMFVSLIVDNVWIAWLGFFIALIISLILVSLSGKLKKIILREKEKSAKFRTK